jgi:hypothetical protein
MTLSTREKLIKTTAKTAGVLLLTALSIKGYENYLETQDLLHFVRNLTGVGVLGCMMVAMYQCAMLSLDD